jgi:hypothetical protein
MSCFVARSPSWISERTWAPYMVRAASKVLIELLVKNAVVALSKVVVAVTCVATGSPAGQVRIELQLPRTSSTMRLRLARAVPR